MSKTIIFLWISNIIFYIANIVSICIKGSTIINAVLGWSLAILLAFGIMYLLSRLNKENNKYDIKEKQNDKKRNRTSH